jgi:hypothetical protein
VATILKHSKGGQFIVHAKALPGKPYDATVIPEIEKQIGLSLKRVFCDISSGTGGAVGWGMLVVEVRYRRSPQPDAPSFSGGLAVSYY